MTQCDAMQRVIKLARTNRRQEETEANGDERKNLSSLDLEQTNVGVKPNGWIRIPVKRRWEKDHGGDDD